MCSSFFVFKRLELDAVLISALNGDDCCTCFELLCVRWFNEGNSTSLQCRATTRRLDACSRFVRTLSAVVAGGWGGIYRRSFVSCVHCGVYFLCLLVLTRRTRVSQVQWFPSFNLNPRWRAERRVCVCFIGLMTICIRALTSHTNTHARAHTQMSRERLNNVRCVRCVRCVRTFFL